MTRHSFHTFQALLGLPGAPVEWRDGYVLSDMPFSEPVADGHERNAEPPYPFLQALVPELHQRSQPLQPRQHPFAVAHARHCAAAPGAARGLG